jgi:hypothetical protein
MDITVTFFHSLDANIKEAVNRDRAYTLPAITAANNNLQLLDLQDLADAALRAEEAQIATIKLTRRTLGNRRPPTHQGSAFMMEGRQEETDDDGGPPEENTMALVATGRSEPYRVQADQYATVLYSQAEKAIRESTGETTGERKFIRTCWGCQDEGHLWTQCPKRGDPEIAKLAAIRGKEMFDRWNKYKAEPKSVTRSLLTQRWHNMGFEDLESAQAVAEIMEADTTSSRRRILLSNLKKGNAGEVQKKRAPTSRGNETTQGSDTKAARMFPCYEIEERTPTGGMCLAMTRKTKDTNVDISPFLPFIRMPIGDDFGVASLKMAVDTCAALNLGYYPYHKQIMEQNPEVVEEFREYSSEGFETYRIGGVDKDGEGIKVVASITYKTPYTVLGTMASLTFALTNQTACTTLLGISAIYKMKMALTLYKDSIRSELFDKNFAVTWEGPRVESEPAPISEMNRALIGDPK